MNEYVDFSIYPSEEIIKMLREKQKEYIILIQSEKIAKRFLNQYEKEFFISNYHSRINNEYYLLYERAVKKNLIDVNAIKDINIYIPIQSVILRLEESQEEVLKNNRNEYIDYKLIVDEISEKIKMYFNNSTILYKEGYLYLINDQEEMLMDEALNKLFEKKTLIK